MANPTVALTLNKFPGGVDNTQHLQYLRGTAVISANGGTYVAGGILIPTVATVGQYTNYRWKFNTSDGSGASALEPRTGPSSSNPIQANFFSAFVNTYTGASSLFAGGYLYVYNAVTFKLQIMVASGGAAGSGAVYEELTGGASIPAQVLNDVIKFEVVFERSYS